MGIVKFNKTEVKDVSFLRVKSNGELLAITSTGAVKVIKIVGYGRYKVTGEVDIETLMHNNSMYFKGYVLNAEVGNCAHVISIPETVEVGNRTIRDSRTFEQYYKMERNRERALGLDKANGRTSRNLYLNGKFVRVELEGIINREFKVELSGKIRSLIVGNCLDLQGPVNKIKVENVLFYHSK